MKVVSYPTDTIAIVENTDSPDYAVDFMLVQMSEKLARDIKKMLDLVRNIKFVGVLCASSINDIRILIPGISFYTYNNISEPIQEALEENPWCFVDISATEIGQLSYAETDITVERCNVDSEDFFISAFNDEGSEYFSDAINIDEFMTYYSS